MIEREREQTMNASTVPFIPVARSTLDLAFGFGKERTRGTWIIFFLVGLGIHGAASLAVHATPPTVARAERVTTVELTPPPPPADPEPEKVAPLEPTEEPRSTAHAAPASAPRAARAGALMAAKETAPSAKQEELVDFVTDPNGTTYGSGVVARGGTADHGERGAIARGVGNAPARNVSPAPGEGLALVSNLSRRAALEASNPCAGFYPSEASADSGAVTLTLVVRGDGGVASAAVVSEMPAGQGFAKAARSCMQQQRFEPALDKSGNAVAAATTIKVRFTR